MNIPYKFPFGKNVTTVEQKDRAHKKVFVLGVYASAVHAKWLDTNNRVVVNALAVASEPYIFWRGDNAKKIIAEIKIPPALGKLIPAASNLNGPSGNALDNYFLKPLGITRDDAWLCDLVPHSCRNLKQKEAIEREYEPLISKYALSSATLPPVPEELTDEKRRKEILSEIHEANPETIILLGNEPVKWFLKYYDNRWNTLSDFGDEFGQYGKVHEAGIEGRTYKILPLCHPRQAAKLGSHSAKWTRLHEEWMQRMQV